MMIVPIHELNRRIPEAGRIRLGQKGDKGQPQKLARFRFTSANKDALDKLSVLYGGLVKPWPGAPTPGQSQLIIDSPKVRITLPPDPLGDGPIYEMWSGGGNQRRCDGIECMIPTSTEPVPCICKAQERLDCKVTTRLNVILRDIPFAGVWRIESHGWHSAHEWPGSVDLILLLQARGLAQGELAVEERKSVANGLTRRFNVAVLTGGDLTIDEMASALGSVSSLGPAPVRELEAPADNTVDILVDKTAEDAEFGQVSDDAVEDTYEDISDAVIVEEEPVLTDLPAPSNTGSSSTLPAWQKALHATIGDLITLPEIDLTADQFRHALVMLVTDGRTQSSSELDSIERKRALDLTTEILSGERRFVRVENDRLIVSRKKETA